METIVHHLSIWIPRIFLLLGGFAGMTRIWEWVINRPKIIGEIRQVVVGSYGLSPNTPPIGVHVMIHAYLVNKRIKPTTVKGFEISAKIKGRWKIGKWMAIPANFRLSEYPNINFGSAHLYDKAGLDLLEYGKGVNGWLRVMFEGEKQDDFNKASYRIVIIDAFDGRHVITYNPSKGKLTGGMAYYPGAGISER